MDVQYSIYSQWCLTLENIVKVGGDLVKLKQKFVALNLKTKVYWKQNIKENLLDFQNKTQIHVFVNVRLMNEFTDTQTLHGGGGGMKC